MPYGNIVAWVVGVCTNLRLSQRKTLGELVVGAIRCRRVSEADLGRSMRSKTCAKHRIKRVWRFLRNPRIEPVDGARALVVLASKACKGRLIIDVDWVDIRQDHVLRASVPLRGRSVPILFAAYRSKLLRRSRNTFEDGFFLALKSMLPEGTEAVIVADRGFGRSSLARHLQELGLSYVIRVSRGAIFTVNGKSIKLPTTELTPRKGIDWGFGSYCKTRPVKQRIVGYWQRKQSEPWILATDLKWGWKRIVGVYRLRMLIEELFRDEKNLRFGWGLRQSQLSSPERLERLLLVLAFAYIFLLLLGIFCTDTMQQKRWSSTSSRSRPTSAFVVARIMLPEVHTSLGLLLRILDEQLELMAEGNWG
jgi:hypothetical protein